MSSSKRAIEVRVKLGSAEPQPSSRENVPRSVRLLALAHRWHRLIDSEDIRDQAEVARRTGLTKARVTQIMNLRWLSPLIQWQCVAENPTSSFTSATPLAHRAPHWNDQHVLTKEDRPS